MPDFESLFGLVLVTILGIAAIIAVVGLAIYVWVFVAGTLGEWQLKRQMNRAGRCMSRRDRKRIAREGGTFITESFTLGWGMLRLWWIPEDLTHQRQILNFTEEEYLEATRAHSALPWDRWCWDNLVSPETGRASLVSGWTLFSRWRITRIQRRYSGSATVETWSAMVQLERAVPESRQSDPSCINSESK